jgi:hypothetical protein
MPTEFAIVDLFAGPGGLAEGFSSIRNKDGSQPFRIALSVEKETSAFETLGFEVFSVSSMALLPLTITAFSMATFLSPPGSRSFRLNGNTPALKRRSSNWAHQRRPMKLMRGLHKSLGAIAATSS